MQAWSKFLTIAAGVLAAIVCYALLVRMADVTGLVNTATSHTAVNMTVANIGALGAALLVALWPADKRHSTFEALTTWAVATIVLMYMVAPHVTTPQNVAVLQAAR